MSKDFMQIIHAVRQQVLELSERHDVTPAQLFILHQIAQHGSLAMGQAASMLHCDPSNITGIVDRLVSQQLISRQESPQDRRTKTLQLTAKGHQKLNEILDELPRTLGWDTLSTSERTTLYQLIQKIRC